VKRLFLHLLVKSPEGYKLATKWAVASDKSVVARAMYEDTDHGRPLATDQIKAPVTMLYPWDSSSGLSASSDGPALPGELCGPAKQKDYPYR